MVYTAKKWSLYVWILICISRFISKLLRFLEFLRQSQGRYFLSVMKYKFEKHFFFFFLYGNMLMNFTLRETRKLSTPQGLITIQNNRLSYVYYLHGIVVSTETPIPGRKQNKCKWNIVGKNTWQLKSNNF